VKGKWRKANGSCLYQDFHNSISRFYRRDERQRFYIAYSGGVDSHVLLHLCSTISQLKEKLAAVYVHHGLQAEAGSWASHCEKTAKDLGVKFLTLRVDAQPDLGESPEEAARNARYAALKSLIDTDDVLLVAQHREDQLETVLLQLFRGCGLRGLSGMPESTAFGSGVMLRPLLNMPKQAISVYAETHQLSWVEDPSNQSNDYDRNFLRNNVVPLLKQRWPAIDKTVARSAGHCADAQALVDEVTDELFGAVFNRVDKTLDISRLMEHHSHPQQLIIRHWFRYLGLKMPTQAFISRILSQVVAAAKHRDPILSGPSYDIRRYRDKLYCLSKSLQQVPQDRVWPVGETSINVSFEQTLSCQPSSKGIPLETWQSARIEIRLRRGGEKICLPRREGHHSLKKLFQEAGVPPWERDAMPLIYLDGTLAAVGDKWISAAFYDEKYQGCIDLFLGN
jgi:tRNA(Ile)-lysidine synthase